MIELRGWDRESGLSVACVEWSSTGTTNVYRVGHKGKVDLKYVQEGEGGFYYRDHLIILGDERGASFIFIFIMIIIECVFIECDDDARIGELFV